MFFKVIGRLTASVFRGIGKFFYLTFRSISKHPIRALLSLIITVAVLSFLYSTSLFGLANPSSAKATVIQAVANTPQPEAKSTEFLLAVKDGKGDAMYNLLSDSYKKILKERGINDAKAMQVLVSKKLQDITGQQDTRLNYTFTYSGGARFRRMNHFYDSTTCGECCRIDMAGLTDIYGPPEAFSGNQRSRRTNRLARRGILPGEGDAPAGTSSARPWR